MATEEQEVISHPEARWGFCTEMLYAVKVSKETLLGERDTPFNLVYMRPKKVNK